MIEKAAAYKTQDGITHATLEAAQKHALAKLLNIDAGIVVDMMIDNATAIIAILKLKPRKPRAVKAKKSKAPALPK